MKTIAYVGNKNRYDYNCHIESTKREDFKVYDLMNTSQEQITQDLLEATDLVVIGDWWELPEDARDIMGLAQIIGKPITFYNDVPADFQKVCVINFCMGIADGLLSNLLTGDND